MSITDIAMTAKEYRTLQAEIKDMEAQADALKQILIRECDIRQAEEIQAEDYTIRYKLVESARLDSSKLKAEHPELYQAYSKSSVSTRFTVA